VPAGGQHFRRVHTWAGHLAPRLAALRLRPDLPPVLRRGSRTLRPWSGPIGCTSLAVRTAPACAHLGLLYFAAGLIGYGNHPLSGAEPGHQHRFWETPRAYFHAQDQQDHPPAAGVTSRLRHLLEGAARPGPRPPLLPPTSAGRLLAVAWRYLSSSCKAASSAPSQSPSPRRRHRQPTFCSRLTMNISALWLTLPALPAAARPTTVSTGWRRRPRTRLVPQSVLTTNPT
jgi:hypothetical protein